MYPGNTTINSRVLHPPCNSHYSINFPLSPLTGGIFSVYDLRKTYKGGVNTSWQTRINSSVLHPFATVFTALVPLSPLPGGNRTISSILPLTSTVQFPPDRGDYQSLPLDEHIQGGCKNSIALDACIQFTPPLQQLNNICFPLSLPRGMRSDQLPTPAHSSKHTARRYIKDAISHQPLATRS